MGGGSEIAVWTVVIDENSGDQGIVTGFEDAWMTRGRTFAVVHFGGQEYDRLDLEDLNIAADQSWRPE